MNVKNTLDLLKPEVGKIVTKVGQVVTNPNALTAGTVVGVVSTTGLAIRATFKASDALNEYDEDEELDVFDKLRIVSKYYIGTTLSGLATIGMAIGANRASAWQSATVASGCAVVQELAEKTQKKLEASEKNSEEKSVQLNKAMLSETPPDRYLWCRDSQTGAMFKTNKEILDHADGQIRERFQKDQWTTINELYSMIGVDRVEIGDDYIISDTDRLHPLDITPVFGEDGSIQLKLFYFQESLANGYYN